MVLEVLLGTAVLSLLWPAPALAWGPAMHLQLANGLMDQLAAMPREIQHLLSTYPMQFFYGCIASDLMQARRTVTDQLEHCHNWDVGFRLLARAGEQRLRSFTLGYLCHLAADIYAHHCFIPARIVESFQRPMMRHIYWELRLDSHCADEPTLRLLQMISRADFSLEDKLLETGLRRTLFSFRTSRRIFHGILLMSRIEEWQDTLANRSERSGQALDFAAVRKLQALSLQAMQELLQKQERSRFRRFDPRGEERLALAKRLRRKLQRLDEREGAAKGRKAAAKLVRLFERDLERYEDEIDFLRRVNRVC